MSSRRKSSYSPRRDDDEQVLIKDVVKVSTLGEGSQGTVWTARLRGNSRRFRKSTSSIKNAPFALKQRLIKRADAAMRDSKSSSAFREIEFCRRVANRHPSLFSRLYDWEITVATPDIKEAFNTEVGGTTREGRSSLRQFTHVLTTLSARKEGVLRSVYHTLTRAQWLSMLSQICYAIALIHEKGFSHGDVWEANIAFMSCPKNQEIAINRTTVPSLGYIWSVIDYGSVEFKADETEQEKKKKRAVSYELDDLVSLASGEDDAIEDCDAQGEDLNSPSFRKKVLSSIDGPSVRLTMKQTGLPLGQSLALLNLDSYVWHVCGKMKSEGVRPWIERGALLQLADINASYKGLATSFARLTREAMK